MKRKRVLAVLVAIVTILLLIIRSNEAEKTHTKEIEQLELRLCGFEETIEELGHKNMTLQKQAEKLEQEKKVALEEKEAAVLEIEDKEKKLQAERAKTQSANRGSVTRQEPKQEQSKDGMKLLGTFEATAYDDSVESQGQWVGQTATGMSPQVGVIAVDPNVIPLHTKLYVEGYNGGQVVTAADTGGAIKGNRIDVFLNTREECRAWGRKNVKVWLAE